MSRASVPLGSKGAPSPCGRPDAARHRPPLGAEHHRHEVRARRTASSRSPTRRSATSRRPPSSGASPTRASARSRSRSRDAKLVALAGSLIFLNQIGFVYGLHYVERLDGGADPRHDADLHRHLRDAVRLRARSAAGSGRRRSARSSASASSPRATAASPGKIGGDLLALFTAATWAGYSVTIAPLMRRYSPFRISAVVLAIGWVPLAVVGAVQTAHQGFHFGWATWLGFALRGRRAAVPDEHPLVHRDRPRRPVARVAVREPAAVLRRPLRAPAPGRAPEPLGDRRRLRDRRRDRPRPARGGRLPGRKLINLVNLLG